MKNSRYLTLILFLAYIACTVSADAGIPQTEETQGITTVTAMQLIGKATEEDTIVLGMDDGYYAGGWPPAPPIAPSSVIYTSAYSEDTLADQGAISYTKSITFDTRGVATENQNNLETQRIIAFIGSETGILTSAETLLLDGSGAGTDTRSSLTCPFASTDYTSIIPPFCNIVEQGSEVDLTQGSLATGTEERFIMQVSPDDYYGLSWPWPVSDPGTEMNYDFTLTGTGISAAVGSASVFTEVHIQEGRNVVESYSPETGRDISYPQSSDLVYSELTTASGFIDLFRKEMSYQSRFTGPAGTWTMNEPT